MPTQIRIRCATHEDAAELHRMQQRFVEHHEALDRHMRFNRAVTGNFESLVPRLLENQDQVILVADAGDRGLAGFLWGLIRENAPLLLPEKYGYIGQTWTDDHARRTGVASRLVAEAHAWFKGKGVDVVKLSVLHRNPGGRAFWERQGFDEFFHEVWYDLP